ncbi:MAG: HlyC/CorC family transporter [Caldilineaceae bacterium]|nr:HlyC/CorC family transporter [Caldilineaceae bacterium]
MEVEFISALLVLIAVMGSIAFVAAAEVSLASTTRGRVRHMIDAGVDRAKVLDTLLNDPARFLSTLMLLKSAAYITGGAAALWLMIRQQWPWAEGILLMAAVGFALVTVQIAARAFTLRHPERVALALGSTVQTLSWILLPFSALLRWMGRQVRGEAKDVTAQSIFLSEDGLRYLINVGEGEGVIEEEEKQMIASIFEMGETIVREIMVPRLDVVALDVDAPINDALDMIIKKGHSRIPVYEESIDHIIGFLYAKDLLRCFREGQVNPPLRQLMRKAYFVPESKKLDELFHDMQMRRVHAAIVVDEYGGTAGLVTIEDLLEEIVGEIQDEYDSEKPIYQQLAPTAYAFNARIDLETVSDLVGVDLTEENDVDTLGGFIYNQLGRVPEQGESLTYADRRFTVLSVDARRIGQVRVEWHAPVVESEDEAVAPVKSLQESKGGANPYLRTMT